MRDVSYVSLRTGFVLDVTGQLLRTDNAGNSWQILNAGTALRPQAVAALSSAIVVLAGPVGVQAFDRRRPDVQGQPGQGDPRGLAVRHRPLRRRRPRLRAQGAAPLDDSGATWTAIKRPTPKTRVNDVDLVGSSTIYLLDADGDDVDHRAIAAGAGARCAGLGTELGYAVRFSDSRHGYVAVGEFGADQAGYVLRTDDGGRTWQPQLVAARALTANGIAVAGRTSAYALTRANALFLDDHGGLHGPALAAEHPGRVAGRRPSPAGPSGSTAACAGARRR